MDYEQYRQVQSLAKRVLAELHSTITSEDTEQSIAQRARDLLTEYGAPETWYHGVHALVLLGSRSCLSVSGRAYGPSAEKVGTTNLITVDLSPVIDGCWGDCARSFVVEEGRTTSKPNNEVFQNGLRVLDALHGEVRDFARSGTTFHGLYSFVSESCYRHGCENLDFSGNFGHSIAKNLNDRIYIEKGNMASLGSAALFTFEPHIRFTGSQWGFKREDIYFFSDDGSIREL